jgi:SAM-dependent methyltransferase
MHSGERTSPDGATVAAYDIARLAGVGRAAVSNWRRRYADFPKPVGGSAASPLYALAEVEAWLTRHGRQFQVSPGDRVWQRVRGAVDDLALGDLLGYLGGFLVFLSRAPEQWRRLARRRDDTLAGMLSAAIRKAVPELPDGPGGTDPVEVEWVAILREAAEAAEGDRHREVLDFACARNLEIHARRRLVTTEPVAELMVDLAGATGGTVLDPACGVGTLLRAAHRRGAEAVLGQEVDAAAARLATARLLLHGAPARVHAGDSLLADAYHDEMADAVVCDPPMAERSWGYEDLTADPRWQYGLPPRGEPELAWAQHCLSHVKPGGRAVVLMPAAAASRRAGRRIRSNLLRAGALRAVVTIPGSLAGTVSPPDLWVLRRPEPDDQAPSHLLLMDASDAGDDSGMLPAAADAWRAFQRDPGADLPDAARAVPIIDLLDDEVDISPSSHLAGPLAADSAGFRPTRDALRDAVSRLAASMPEFDEAPVPAPVATVSLGELVRAGVVVLHQAPLRMPTDAGETPVLTARDVRHRRPPSGHTEAGPGVVMLEPGDVVAPVAAREPAALVVAETGAALGPQLYLLRADPERIDPHFLAGFLRVAQTIGGQRGSLASRSDVHRLTLPRLSISEQRRYREVFQRLAAFEENVRETATLADSLIRRGLAGLAIGSLQPGTGGE